MRQKITERTLTRKAPGEIWDEYLPGFGVRIGQRARTFFVMARHDGKQKRRTVGNAATMPLSEARAKAREMLQAFAKGIDPEELDKLARLEAARARRNTFAAVAVDYMAEHGAHLKTGAELQRKLDVDILPKLGALPIKSIRRPDVKALVREKAATSPVAANRVLELVRAVLNFAIDEELIEANPAARIKPSKEVARERVLDAAEIRNFWTGLDAAPIEQTTRAALRFLLATGQRRGEAVGARWDEIDFEAKTWRIPASRAKREKEHVVPLSDFAMDLLKDLARDGEFVFAARPGAPLSPYTVTQGMRKALPACGLADTPATPHDLRRTFASNLARLGFPRLTISKLLNHAEGGITSVYDRHEYSGEMRVVMQAWGAEQERIISGQPPAKNVVPLKRTTS